MELSSEDSLRLNVLIANAEAVRIDENALIVYGLNGEREMKVQLNPNCRSDKYLMAVREMLSSAQSSFSPNYAGCSCPLLSELFQQPCADD